NLDLYARWAHEALPEWLALERRTGERLFVRTGALFVGSNRAWLTETEATLRTLGIPTERIDGARMRTRFPQLAFGEGEAIYEPEAGVIYARRAVQSLVRTLVADGVTLIRERVDASSLIASSRADAIVFAAGPWLPSLFPDVLRDAILPTRQDVFFFGPPPGDDRFSPERFPAWVAFDEGVYGVPDLENRGVKVAFDAHGPEADPERMMRAVDDDAVRRMREVLRRHLPALADAPLLESRVCQYENTTNGHFLIDRLPDHDRVWIAGGGSGHGFKHGPTVGRYVADLIEWRIDPEPAFVLGGRPPRQRAVY
ncbi:MAG TPA: FAD-dependent oxidoreductase, partial [Vicinamibacterales bacterium]